MPTHDELHEAHASSLANAIQKHGGYVVVAEKLGLKRKKLSKEHRHWENLENVKIGILNFNKTAGLNHNAMPSQKQLKDARLSGLATAISQHGGMAIVAKMLGLVKTSSVKDKKYWNENTIQLELEEWCTKHGTVGIMPTKEALEKAGRLNLATAIKKIAGFPAFAQRIGWKLSYEKKPDGFWDERTNLKSELFYAIAQLGIEGTMPKDAQLRMLGRSDLLKAIGQHGGAYLVAKQFGLSYAGPVHLTLRTALDVELTVRVIQPLAESNLLSSPQILVILRRAGLLEFRNPKIRRLAVSLSSGNHQDIEEAVADLLTIGGTIAEDEDVEEVGASELEDDYSTTSLNHQCEREASDIGVLASAQLAPGSGREQAIISFAPGDRSAINRAL